MVDGLAALREAVRGGKDADIKLVGDNIHIGSHQFPKDAMSSWKVSGGARLGTFYKLHELWFYWVHHALSKGAYITKCRDAKLAMVSTDSSMFPFYAWTSTFVTG